jgi:hypothetical protein
MQVISATFMVARYGFQEMVDELLGIPGRKVSRNS